MCEWQVDEELMQRAISRAPVVGAPQGAAPEISDKAGCCALVVLLKGTTLYVANVGDSRVVRRAHPCARGLSTWGACGGAELWML